MSNCYVPFFYRIDFAVIPSYIEFPCSKINKPIEREKRDFGRLLVHKLFLYMKMLALGFETKDP